jgi:programmed cell death protein 5
LEAIRQKRLAELQAQMGGQGGAPNPQQMKQAEQQRQAGEERRQMILSQLLTGAARERLSRVALVKPEKARGVEDLIISAAQRGQVSTVDEPQLISLLEQIKDKEQKEQTKVTIQRKKVWDDDD